MQRWNYSDHIIEGDAIVNLITITRCSHLMTTILILTSGKKYWEKVMRWSRYFLNTKNNKIEIDHTVIKGYVVWNAHICCIYSIAILKQTACSGIKECMSN